MKKPYLNLYDKLGKADDILDSAQGLCYCGNFPLKEADALSSKIFDAIRIIRQIRDEISDKAAEEIEGE